ADALNRLRTVGRARFAHDAGIAALGARRRRPAARLLGYAGSVVTIPLVARVRAARGVRRATQTSCPAGLAPAIIDWLAAAGAVASEILIRFTARDRDRARREQCPSL